MKRVPLILIALSAGLIADAQQRFVVADKLTHEPVAQASVYTKEGGRFASAISNDQGEVSVSFPFTRLTITHLNYERRVVTRVSDTIFLTPRYRQTVEVVVSNVEPRWIREKLRQVVKTKWKTYFSQPRVLSYDYQTRSIDLTSYYAYRSRGLVQMKSFEHDRYSIRQHEGHIVCVDSTRLTDVASLRRMLYEDFVDELDGGFIRSHKFSQNGEFESDNKNEVELVFRSKNHTDDRGRIVIDTARCVIRSAYRVTGTATNKRERMNKVLLSMARAISGYRIDKWNRIYHVDYAEGDGGTMFPASVSYKFYFEGYDREDDPRHKDYDQQTGGGFPNMEATLRLTPPSYLPDDMTWLPLPGSWYLRLSSERERQQEIDLSHLPATFDVFTGAEEFQPE